MNDKIMQIKLDILAKVENDLAQAELEQKVPQQYYLKMTRDRLIKELKEMEIK